MLLPKYQNLKKISENNNSIVYRGNLKENNLPIIIKILKEKYYPEEKNQYPQEYEITKYLKGNNIIKSYSCEEYENHLLITFEDINGKSLDLLLKELEFNIENFLKIAILITSGLNEIHRYGIIHKDINPSNIIFNCQNKKLKIIDFGIATFLQKKDPTLKNPNILEGTLAYISPEQTGRINRSLDYRTDFYSLGVTFYEMIAHKLPFAAKETVELIHCHTAKAPIPLQDLNHDIPVTISNIVAKLMAKDPKERYQSAFGLKLDLEQCLNQLLSQKKSFFSH